MASVYDYEIGTTSSTTNLEELATLVNPPRGTFQEWSRLYTRGDGRSVGHGYPRVEWHFDTLTQDMIDQLRSFCTAGNKSAAIYIKTRRYDGTFAKFSAVMHWPEDQLGRREMVDYYRNVTIEFTKLVAV